MEQRPSLQQIEDVTAHCRNVLDLAKRNNRGISGKKTSAQNTMLLVAGLEIGPAIGYLIRALRDWGMQEQGDSFEGIGCGDLLAAQCVLLQRSQEILDTYGLRPGMLFGTNGGVVNTPDGAFPAIAEECLSDIEYWLERLQSVAELLQTIHGEVGADRPHWLTPLMDEMRLRIKALGKNAKRSSLMHGVKRQKQRMIAALDALNETGEYNG